MSDALFRRFSGGGLTISEMMLLITQVPGMWVRNWHVAAGSAEGVDAYIIDNAVVRFGQSPITHETMELFSMHAQIALSNAEQFSYRNEPYAMFFLMCKIPVEVVAAWDDSDMSLILPYVIAGCPLDKILIALENGIDSSLMTSISGGV